MINKINGSASNQFGISQENKTKITKQPEGKSQDAADVVETGKRAEGKVTYENPAVNKPNTEEIAKLWEQAHRATESLRVIVKELLQRQGMTFQEALGGEKNVNIDEQARTDAAKLIADDGELGVKAVSDRIVAFAKALSGGDKGKIAELRDAITQGFSEAAEMLNAELPDVSKKTYDEVMKQLDAWEAEESKQ